MIPLFFFFIRYVCSDWEKGKYIPWTLGKGADIRPVTLSLKIEGWMARGAEWEWSQENWADWEAEESE